MTHGPIEAAAARPDGDRFAADLRAFGPLGIIAIAAILLTGNVFAGDIVLPVGAVLVLLWARLSRTPWSALGFVRPRSWALTIVGGIVIGIALKLVMKALVMPLLGADPINRAYHYLAGNTAALPVGIWAMFVAGFAEETVFRGYLFERFEKLLGSGQRTKVLIVVLTSLWFGIAHLANQGLSGAAQATIVGLVYGTMFAATRRIWLIMIAHTAFDLTALWLIYNNLENKVAHLIFR